VECNCVIVEGIVVMSAGQKCGGKHSGKCRIDKVIAALSESLSQVSHGATRWSISDTTAGLFKLYQRHTKEGVSDSIKGVVVRDR